MLKLPQKKNLNRRNIDIKNISGYTLNDMYVQIGVYDYENEKGEKK